MKTKEQNKLVTYVLHLAALKMLADCPIKSQLVKEAEKAWNNAYVNMNDGEKPAIQHVANTMRDLAITMARCQNLEQLTIAANYAESLLRGEVLIADIEQ